MEQISIMGKMRRTLVFFVGVGVAFNSVAIPGLGRDFSVGFITVALYFLSVLPILSFKHLEVYNKKCISRIVLFFAFLCFVNICNSSGASVSWFNLSIFSCILFFICLLSHSSFDDKVMEIAFFGFVIGSIVISILFMSGMGIAFDNNQRMTIFGENANYLGIYVSTAFLYILNEFILNKKIRKKIVRCLLIFLTIPLLFLCFATGSRTAFLILLSGVILSYFLYPSNRSSSKIVILTICSVALFFVLSKLFKSDILVVRRIIATIETGDLSNRERYWAQLWPIARDNYMFGIGETGLSLLFDDSPHNVILEVLLYTGVIGLFIMLSFWWRIFNVAIKAFICEKKVTPLVVSLPIIASILSGQVLKLKIAWMVYVFILNAYHSQSIRNINN